MPIWFKKNTALADFIHLNENTMGAHLGLEFTEIGDDYLKATLPVDHRTQQPYGLLHGGASAMLAETLGSVASALVVDHDAFMTLGIELNASHIRGVRSGFVTGTCRPLHLGRTLHVWDIRIEDVDGKTVCISRLSVMIRKR